MGQFFPFEVGCVPFKELILYGPSQKVISEDLPPEFQLYIDDEITNDLPDPCILDYIETENKEVGLFFIPPIPLKMSEYDFYSQTKPMKIKKVS